MVRRKFGKKAILWGTLAGVLTVLLFTFYIWHLTENIRLGYEIVQGENRLRTMKEDIKKLQTKRAEYLALERVNRTARQALKLGDPREDQIIYENR